MLFKVDENLPIEVASILNDAGHNAMTAEEQGLAGKRDEILVMAVRDEGRCLVTLDLDFADLRTYPPDHFTGSWCFVRSAFNAVDIATDRCCASPSGKRKPCRASVGS